MSLGLTISAAVQGTSNFLLVVLAGFVLQKLARLFDKHLSGLSKLVFQVLLPCLLFVSVSKAMSVDALTTLASECEASQPRCLGAQGSISAFRNHTHPVLPLAQALSDLRWGARC